MAGHHKTDSKRRHAFWRVVQTCALGASLRYFVYPACGDPLEASDPYGFGLFTGSLGRRTAPRIMPPPRLRHEPHTTLLGGGEGGVMGRHRSWRALVGYLWGFQAEA